MTTRKHTTPKKARKPARARKAKEADRMERVELALRDAIAGAITVAHAMALTSLPRATDGGVHESYAYTLRRVVVNGIQEALEALRERR